MDNLYIIYHIGKRNYSVNDFFTMELYTSQDILGFFIKENISSLSKIDYENTINTFIFIDTCIYGKQFGHTLIAFLNFF